MRLYRLLFVTCALCAALIACGGGGRGGSVIPGSGGSQSSTSRPAVTLRMVIPNTTQITSARTKKREFVSASVASIVYAITAQSGTTSLVSGANYTNVAASPSPCTSGSNGLTCSISILASIRSSGTYNVTIATYDTAQTASCTPGGTGCVGNLLGLATLPETITTGSATPVAVTLGGIPAYLQGQSVTGYTIGSGDNQAQNQLTIFGPTPQTGIAEFLDADGNVIIPPGAPIVTASSSNTGALTVAIATPTPGQYQLTWTPVKSGAYVQPGTYTVTLSLAVPNTSTVINYPLQISIVHSAVFAGVCGGQSNAATVYGYLDGNTNGAAPDLTIWSNLAECGQAPGLATDRTGNLYVADGTTLWEFAVAPGMNPSPIASAGPAQTLTAPVQVAVDGNDDVYVVDATLGLLAFNSPGPSGFAAPVATFSNSDFDGYSPGGVAADNAGNLYAAVQLDGDLGIFQLPSLQGGLNSGNTPNQIVQLSPSQYSSGAAIAVDVQPSPSTPPNIWLGGEQSPSYNAALWSFSSVGALLNTYPLASLGNVVEGVAVDGNGVVYTAYANGITADEIAQLAPPGYSPAAGMPIPSPTPYVVASGGQLPGISIAVAPAAAVRGSQGGGSPQPLATPSPAAATHRP
jgi:hypothetical protein